jgi:DTW domain-containing protein
MTYAGFAHILESQDPLRRRILKDVTFINNKQPGERDRCLVCNRSRATCFCGFVKPFPTATRFVILMHPKEFKRQKTGTGRLTGLALKNSEIIMGSDFSENKRLISLLEDGSSFPVVLFPGPGSRDLADEKFSVPVGKKLVIIVIDGTWRMADSIYKKNRLLQGLPRIRFTPSEKSRLVFKRQPRLECLSTIEAVHAVLDLLDQAGLEELRGSHKSLLESLDRLVEFQLRFMPANPVKINP